MRVRRPPASMFRVALIALPLSFALTACETLQDLNPLEEKKAPLTGDRKPVFPQGVPGVEFNAPPQQPSNSNIDVQQQPQQPQANPDGPQNANRNDDPWAGQRR